MVEKNPYKYANFAGQIIRKAWCTVNDELYSVEKPLSPEYVLSVAEECGISTMPPPRFLEKKRHIERLTQVQTYGDWSTSQIDINEIPKYQEILNKQMSDMLVALEKTEDI